MHRDTVGRDPPITPAGAGGPSDGADHPATADLDRLGRLNWWMGVGLVFALGAFGVIATAAQASFGPVLVTAAVAIVATTVAAGVLTARRLSARGDDDSPRDDAMPRRLAVVAVAGGVVALIATHWLTASGPEGSAFAAPAVATGGLAISARRGVRHRVVVAGALVSAALTAGAGYAFTGAVDGTAVVGDSVVVALVAAGMVGGAWSWEAAQRSDRARRLEADLAVADERLRFAADLHDIQGHHLHVIALESELATRLAESDPAAAGAHMAQVQAHARSALADTRGLVQGYRRASLADELANATRVLAAAGVDGRLDHGTEAIADDLAEPARHLLGLVAREATTNVLRHSHADQARLALHLDADQAQLGVRNNGAEPATDPLGSGLTTLASRLEDAGGTLAWERHGDWFTVTARVPLAAERQP